MYKRQPDEFQLDPPESLRHLNFMNGCWDRELDALVPTRPDMYIAHCTGWCYEEFKHPELDNLDRLFAAVRQEQGEDLSQVYTMSAEVEDEFRRIAATMLELPLFCAGVPDRATGFLFLKLSCALPRKNSGYTRDCLLSFLKNPPYFPVLH